MLYNGVMKAFWWDSEAVRVQQQNIDSDWPWYADVRRWIKIWVELEDKVCRTTFQ